MAPPADDPDRWTSMEAYLRRLAATLPARPDALVVVSAHWETARPTVTVQARPPLLYDYYGFPPETYRLAYPAAGDPELADRIRWLLADAGIDSAADPERGFDHGVFIPLMLAFPEADIPIVQLSLQSGLDPERHLQVGRALSSLRDANMLIVASGMSYHNLGAFSDPAFNAAASAFDSWLTTTLCEDMADIRSAKLIDWVSAPGARECHPRAEHLLPLMVAVGAVGDGPGRRSFAGMVWGKAVSGYHFAG